MDPTSWQHAKDVIAEALRRPPSERETFVRSHCADPALAEDIVGIIVQQTHDDAATHAPVEEPAFDPGTRIGPYVILDRLGRGGMGEVFLGNDPRLQRKVALKCVIRSLAGSGEQRARVLHEARAAARVNHANVATIHDIVEVADRAFIVMEYVEGESLASRLKRERLSIDQVIDIGRQLAAALTAAHGRDVVHRDLKPANVQLTPEGRAKVLDFGIANAPRVPLTASGASQASDGGIATKTVRFGHPGTPPYMSPEQLLGRAVDARSDVFSLGVVLFEMATGERPFPGSDPLSMVVAHANGAPRATTIDARVPPRLAEIIARALAGDPAQRFASAGDLGAALDSLARARERRDEPFARKLARAGAMAAAVVAGVGILGVVKTFGFNNNFGRTGPFARFGVEPWTEYFRWGLLGITPMVLVMSVAGLGALAIRFAFRTLERMRGPVGRLMQGVRRRGRAIAAALELDDPVVLAQVIAGAGIVALIVFAWHRIDLLNAVGGSFNSAPLQMLMPMRESAPARAYYQIELSVLTLALGAGLYAVLRARRRYATTEGGWTVAVLAALVGAAILLNQLPYRSFNYRDFERADYAGARCYITGESGGEFLILCPASDPPRNRAVRRDDPELHRLGRIENVFRGVAAALSR